MIMIVDDERDILMILDRYLQKLGYDIEAFADPMKALERFKQEPSAFSLVLSDLRMPGMDGVRLAKEMLKVNRDAKILMMTAFEVDDSISSNLSTIRKEDILQKPFRLSDVYAAVRKRLEVS